MEGDLKRVAMWKVISKLLLCARIDRGLGSASVFTEDWGFTEASASASVRIANPRNDSASVILNPDSPRPRPSFYKFAEDFTEDFKGKYPYLITGKT